MAYSGGSYGSPVLSFDSSKLVAAVGLILALAGFVSLALGLIGVAVYLVGMYGLSQNYGSREIFNYALLAEIAGIALAALASGVLLAGVVHGGRIVAMLAMLFFLLLLWGAAIVYGYFKMRLLGVLASYGDSGLASLAAKLYWYGGLLAILFVGVFIQLVGLILEVVFLFSLRPPSQAAPGLFQGGGP